MDQNEIGNRGGNISYSKAGIRQAQINANGCQLNTQNTVQFTVDGVFGALAPTDNQAINTGTTLQACNSCIFAVWVNNTNVIATTQGKIVAAAKLGNGGTGELVVPYPDIVANNALIGLIKVKAGVGVTFVPGTTAFNASNITSTFFDVSMMPTVPQLF